MKGPVLAVLNMKGGVGKTTISAHLMRVLYAKAGVSGLLVDLDPQFNLTQSLVKRADYEVLRDKAATVYGVMEEPSNVSLLAITKSDAPPPEPRAVARRVHSFTSTLGMAALDLVPGDFRLVKYSLMDHDAKLKGVQRRFLQFVDQARQAYGFVCIDCNPSSSFITSCALHSCTHLLIPVKPDLYSVIGVELLHELLGKFATMLPKPETLILLNNVQGKAFDPEIENELRAHKTFGGRVLANALRYSRLLEAGSNRIGFATDRGGPHAARLYRDLIPIATELAGKVGL